MKGRLAVVLSVALAVTVLPPSFSVRAESGTYSCQVTAGYPGAWWDGNSFTPAPHAIGACQLVTLTADSTVTSITTGSGCSVKADVDNNATHETDVVAGTAVPAGAAIWAHCNLGVTQRTVTITLASGSVPASPSRLGSITPFSATASDGTALRGDLYLPRGSGPFATVLELSPYWNTWTGPSGSQDTVVGGRWTMAGPYQAFLDAGFAVALVNVRGTGKSNGCMQWGTPTDWSDASTVIDALASQSWSNGSVGMFGVSYPAWMQFGVMTNPPSALKAVIPTSGIIDLHSLLTYNGARTVVAPVSSAVWTAGTALGAFALTKATALAPFVPSVGLGHATCPRYADDTAAHARLGADGERTPYFQARDLRPALSGTTVPALVTSGMGLTEGSITQFEGLWNTLAGERRFLLGQWGHGLPTTSGFMDTAVDWFDHYLRGAPKTVSTGVVEYQDASGGWHSTTQWPPASTSTSWYLSGPNMVTAPGSVVASARSFQSTGPTLQLCGAPEYLRYVSPPLSSELKLAGNFEIDLTLSSTLPEGNLQVTVWDAEGAGGCADNRTYVARAFTTLRHSVTPGQGQDFPVNTPTTRTIRSLPFAGSIPAGHRVVVTVDAGNAEIVPDARKPLITITTGGGAAGALRLPVLSSW